MHLRLAFVLIASVIKAVETAAIANPLSACLFRDSDEAIYRSHRAEASALGFEVLVYPRTADAPLQTQLIDWQTRESYVLTVLDHGTFTFCTNEGTEWTILEFEFDEREDTLVRYGASKGVIERSLGLKQAAYPQDLITHPTLALEPSDDNPGDDRGPAKLLRSDLEGNQSPMQIQHSTLKTNHIPPKMSLGNYLMPYIRVFLLNMESIPVSSMQNLHVTCTPLRYEYLLGAWSQAQASRRRYLPVRLPQSITSTSMVQAEPGVFEGTCNMSALAPVMRAYETCFKQVLSRQESFGFPKICDRLSNVQTAYVQLKRILKMRQRKGDHGIQSLHTFLHETGDQVLRKYETLCAHFRSQEVEIRLRDEMGATVCGPTPEVIIDVHGEHFQRMLGSFPATQNQFSRTITVGPARPHKLKFIPRLLSGYLNRRQ